MRYRTRYAGDTRHIPAGYSELARDDSIAAVAYGNDRHAIMFRGKAIKPTWHHSFRTNEARDKYIADTLEGWRRIYGERQARRERIKALPNPAKVGDILRCSWGWEQTNVDYYLVIEVKNKTVVLEQIGARSVRGNTDMSDYVVPDPDFRTGKTLSKRVILSENGDYAVKIHDWGSYAYLDKGEPTYRSWYA